MRATTMSFEHHECDARSRVRVTEPNCFWLAWKTHQRRQHHPFRSVKRLRWCYAANKHIFNGVYCLY
jgi:hypothetical protein